MFFVLCAILGCTKIPPKLTADDPEHPANPFYHMLTYDWRGLPVDPTGNSECQPQIKSSTQGNEPKLCNGRYALLRPFTELEDYERYIDNVLKAREDYFNRTGNPKVLIFVHGGLNTLKGSIERALKLHKLIEKGDPGYFPIFINWQASLTASYFDHLFNVRQGEEWEAWARPFSWLLSPFYLAADLARSIGRAPLTWAFQYKSDVASSLLWETMEEKDVKVLLPILRQQKFQVLYGGACPNLPNATSRDGDCRSWTEAVRSSLKYVITQPFKIVTGPFIDGFGTSAWESMLRSTHQLFHHEDEFHTNNEEVVRNHLTGSNEVQGRGGLSKFMRRLQEKMPSYGPSNWDITVVGHSMGTIVLNEMIRRFGDFNYSSIVYMAAACSVREYEDSMFPYLEKKPDTKFYHLMLHEAAEVRDRWEKFPGFVDLPPRGSLLVWIDSFFTKPATHLDMRAGRWINLAVSAHNTPEKIRERISFLVFRAGESVSQTDPQRHGDFTQCPFWKSNFWKPVEEGQKEHCFLNNLLE